jgi:hypothetical protein
MPPPVPTKLQTIPNVKGQNQQLKLLAEVDNLMALYPNRHLIPGQGSQNHRPQSHRMMLAAAKAENPKQERRMQYDWLHRALPAISVILAHVPPNYYQLPVVPACPAFASSV